VAQKELVELIHAHGARALVDGAHVVGQVPLNLHELNADYFVSNCHKWLYAPRGCAFAWCASYDTTRPPHTLGLVLLTRACRLG
jgi:selenocysteine lyase/cysteine desulfurase